MTFIVGVLSVVIALAWRDYINSMFETYVKPRLSWLSPAVSGLAYVLIVSAIGLAVSYLLTMYQERTQEQEEYRVERTKSMLRDNESRVNRVRTVIGSQVDVQASEADMQCEIPTKQRRLYNARSLLGVDDKQVIESAFNDSKEDKKEHEVLTKYEDRLSKLVLPRDIGVMHNRY